jgi:chemotaxis protein histidine kinase CheA
MLLNEIQNLINLLSNDKDSSPEQLSSILRALHRLKGSTGFIGLTEIEEQIRKLEHDIKSTTSLAVEGIDSFTKELKEYHAELSNALS